MRFLSCVILKLDLVYVTAETSMGNIQHIQFFFVLNYHFILCKQRVLLIY